MKKKVAVIGLKGIPAIGGASRSFESILNFIKDEYDITIYSVESHTSQRGFINGYRQIVFKKNKIKVINTFIYLLKSTFHCLFLDSYDLIHVHHSPSGYIIPLLKIKYKVISTIHGIYSPKKFDPRFGNWGNLFFRLFQTLNFAFSDCIVSVCKHDLNYINEHSKKKVVYIPNGIYLNQEYSEKKIEFNNYLLFATGRIYQSKGCHLLIEALHKIRYKEKVLIIGDLNEVMTYKKNILQAAKGLNVEFIDLIKDKSLLMAFIKKANIFVLPSLREAMSNMLLEAASMKCPIICSDIPGNTDIFDESEVTFFKSEDTEHLAERIKWATINKEIIFEKAQRAFKKLEKEYKWEDIAFRYDELYKELIFEKPYSFKRII